MDNTHHFTRDMSPPLPDVGNTSAPPTQGSGRVIPMFYRDDEYDEAMTAELGRPYFRTVEKVKLVIPGDRLSVVEKYVNDAVREQFPREYAQFVKGEEVAENGLPIDHWPLLSRGQCASLKALNIFTVEQIASLTDDQLTRVGMGARQLRDSATAYLEAAEKGATPIRLVRENEERRKENALLKDQLQGALDRLEAAERKLSGANAGQALEPVETVPQEIPETKSVINIPDNWRRLSLPRLKDICETITAAPVTSKDAAIDIIDEYLDSQAA